MELWFAHIVFVYPADGTKTAKSLLYKTESVMYSSRISGLGYYLPKKKLSNQDLEKHITTTSEWIEQRTGIQSRHIAEPEEMPSDMGMKASLQALKQANLQPSELDFIIVATLYPDQLMPNTACVLQEKLGVPQSGALDISAACSGFLYAFTIANQFIQTGTYKNILIVGTEALHHITNYEDRTTCILFGDGAGAFILSRNTNANTSRVYHQELKAYGELGHLLKLSAPGAKHPPLKNTEKENYYIQMEGRKVFKNATQMMIYHYDNTLKHVQKQNQIDWIVPHQANKRILNKFCETTGFPKQKVIINIDTTGNTSSASIPICMGEAVEQGLIKRGQNILMIAVGGGMTSSSIFFKY